MADIDEFRLVRVLGRGAMGVVYLAHDTILDRDVALKVVRVDLSEPSRQRLLTEARAIARLDHPNVVTIHRAGTTSNGEPYLIAELIDGEPLDRVPRPLAPARVLALGRGIARGLAAAHRRGVLHRDIKPSNIVVDASGTPRLLDFGLAKLSGVSDPAAPPRPRAVSLELDATADQPGAAPPPPEVTPVGTPTTATQDGALIGTPRFMAPELWRGEPATARSDLYSLGVVLYELLAGEPPFPHTERAALEAAVLAGDPPDLASRVADLDPQLAALVMRSLARDPAARPESADEVVHQLDRIAAGVAAIPEGNPYRGLAVFEASHRGVFFGRDTEVAAIVDRLRAAPMVVVTGDSGIGKSSLCRAGVLPAITGGALDDGRTWTSRIVALGRRPLAALEDWLAIDPAGLAEGDLASRIARRLQLDASRGLIVLVDQLEELVTQAAPGDAELAASVLAALAEGIPGLKVVAVVRGDFLTRVAALAGLGGAMMRDVHLVRGLTPEDARAVIVGPASAKGVAFEPPAMVDELVASIADRPTALPLLQFALAELWPRRDTSRAVIPENALREIGGVAGALALHADRVVTALGVPERTAARRILLALVTADGTRAARDRDELAGQDPVATAALEALVTGRLVVARDAADGEPQYELAHESLLANWSTLRGWLDDSAGERHQRARLRTAAREWQRLGRRRDLLWRRAQLAEVARLDALPPLDREFVGASRRAGRLRLAIAIAIGLAVPLSVLATQLAGDYRASQRRAARVDEQLAGARDAFASVDEIVAGARRERDASIASFEHEDRKYGETRWTAAKKQFVVASTKLRDLATRLETAVLETGATEVRTAMAEAIYRRMLVADEMRDDATAGELVERLVPYDDGTFIARWRQAQPVTLSFDGATRIELERYSVSATGARVPAAIAAGPGGRLTATLPRGSYRARAIAPGIDPVLMPFVVEHAPVSLSIAVPPPGRVPPGFVYVPSGPFLVGADDTPYRATFFNAMPVHHATTGAFLIGRTEVTFADWLAYLRALPPDQRAARQQHAPRGASESVRLDGGPPGPFTLVLQAASADPLRAREGEPLVYPDRRVTWERLPASGISYDDAVAYAAWLARTGHVPHARLCREAEWERAARGADGRDYPHGDRLSPTDANYDVTHGRKDETYGPDEVGSYPISASPFGLQDMVGNAFEWVETPPKTDAFLRGGSWFYDAPSAMAANRSAMNRGARNAFLGTRICADL